jgi:hypothetical protein
MPSVGRLGYVGKNFFKGPRYLLDPGLISLGQWIVSGPFGKGLPSVLGDLLAILKDSQVRSYLDELCV